MSSSFSFTEVPFTVSSAAAIDANTIRVILSAVPNAFVPANFSIPMTTVVSAVADPYDPNSLVLSVSPGLQPGNYAVTCSGLTAGSPPVAMVAPLNAAFTVLVGPPVTVAPQFATPQANQSALTTLRAHIPSSMKGDVWTQLLNTLGEEEQFAWNQAASVYDQLFLVSAEGSYLDARASAAGGYRRPELVGFTDDVFRSLVVQLSTRKVTLNAFLRVLEIYYGIDAVRAHVRSAEPFVVPDGAEQVFIIDGHEYTLTFHDSDFSDPNGVLAIEAAVAINREFARLGCRAFALPYVDTQSGIVYTTVYTPSRGLRGSVESVSGPFGFPTGKLTLQSFSRVAYVKVTGEGATVVLPATSEVVVRTPNEDGAYLNEAVADVGGGPYLHDPSTSTVVDDTVTTVSQELEESHQYPMVAVASTAGFPDERGYLVFGYGWSYQSEPVPYLGVSGSNLLLDPAYTFAKTIPNGATVNLAARMSDDQVPHGDEDFWLTPSPAGRVACQSDIDSIAAGGAAVTNDVRYPSDVGLGGGPGLPTSGAPRLSDAVMVWGGDDLDAELAAAREA
jgi:hypothetical protein